MSFWSTWLYVQYHPHSSETAPDVLDLVYANSDLVYQGPDARMFQSYGQDPRQGQIAMFAVERSTEMLTRIGHTDDETGTLAGQDQD